MTEVQNNNPNMLLRALSPSAYAKMSEHLTPICLPHRYRIAVPKVACVDMVFPSSGIASVINVTGGVWQEVGLFGNEGVGSMSTLLSAKPTSNLVVMQVPGNGHQIKTKILKAIFESDEEVRELLLSYVEAFISQLTHTATANVQCNATQRLSRWLLMINDRTGMDALPLTHEYIAAMLGVARPSVTVSLRALEATGAIRTGRKLIRIESRPQLLKLAADFYGNAEKDYQQIMAARSHARRDGAGSNDHPEPRL